MIRQNLHTHTTFCDGHNTPEEMILGALACGCQSLGFSGHGPLVYDSEGWTTAMEDVSAYRQEILRLREKYAGRLAVYLGIEQDIDSPDPGPYYDYLIGSVHSVKVGEHHLSVDNNLRIFQEAVDQYFGGDPLAFAEAYYGRVAHVAEHTHCQIVGHFDLVTKFNEGNALFREDDPRYRNAALSALEALCGQGLIFEINTGAVARGYRTLPYPAPFLLRELSCRGEAVCITSDSHSTDTILFGFAQAEELARSCGFSETMVLTDQGFVPQIL